jgi:hypothetical protein
MISDLRVSETIVVTLLFVCECYQLFLNEPEVVVNSNVKRRMCVHCIGATLLFYFQWKYCSRAVNCSEKEDCM